MEDTPDRFVEGVLSGVVMPDVMLPSQFFNRRVGDCWRELNLLVAMLADAIECFVAGLWKGAGTTTLREAADARAWIEGAPAPLRFKMVCDALGLNPERLRADLLALPMRDTPHGRLHTRRSVVPSRCKPVPPRQRHPKSKGEIARTAAV
jgi:hypothetical protein